MELCEKNVATAIEETKGSSFLLDDPDRFDNCIAAFFVTFNISFFNSVLNLTTLFG